MAGRQITARVSHETKKQFSIYAGRCGLADSELAKLLLHRERLQQQLAAAIKTGEFRPPEYIVAAGGRLPTITAHYSRPPQVQEFDAYIQSCSPGLKRGVAVAWILQRELSEKWLQQAFAARGGL